jgi:hypothetical protein
MAEGVQEDCPMSRGISASNRPGCRLESLGGSATSALFPPNIQRSSLVVAAGRQERRLRLAESSGHRRPPTHCGNDGLMFNLNDGRRAFQSTSNPAGHREVLPDLVDGATPRSLSRRLCIFALLFLLARLGDCVRSRHTGCRGPPEKLSDVRKL